MGRSESLRSPQLLFVNPSTQEASKWITAATQLPQKQITTVNLLNGDKLPSREELYEFGGIIGGGARQAVHDADPWIKTYTEFLEAVPPEVPQLLICFSHQAYAKARGATVEAVGQYRYGIADFTKTHAGKADSLLDGLPENFPAFAINGYYVTAPPSDSLELAYSDTHRNEALAYVDRNIRTVQLHPDRTYPLMIRLAKERSNDISRPPALRDAYSQFLSKASQDPTRGVRAGVNGRRMVGNWIKHNFAESSQPPVTVYERPLLEI